MPVRPIGVKRHTLLALLLLPVALSACHADLGEHSPATTQAVSGTLRMTGGPSDATQPGVAGRVVFASQQAREVITAAADGSFSGSLPAGTYRVTGTSPLFGDGQGVCRTTAPVVVTDGAVTGLVVACSRR
jgi:hypothetical protein